MYIDHPLKMASTTDITSLDIQLPASANRSSNVNREEDLIRRNNRRRIMTSTFQILISCFIMYLFIAKVVLDVDLLIKTVDIQDMYINFKINKHTIIVETNFTLKVRFKKKGNGKPSPDFGIFNLTADVIKNHPISAFSKRTYEISGNDQVILVKLDPYQTHLSEKEIRVFQKRLSEGKVWLNLDGDFKWHQKKGLLVFENTKRHMHFSCSISYKALPLSGIHLKRCKPRQ